ncbi:hypothetical protein [Billgrantia endophytica]|uniref:hypothetical protein n=1 Tax=Billgrantia endophytica TaxID=2033802 RepID=UPI001056BC3D|nr:hypothetical protein [Halomonas endophytica]
MPHLSDMEEMVGRIEEDKIKDYMQEALSCYMAKAYRACIVLTYIALFDDIVEKLGELGRVNKKAKKIYDEATKKLNAQDVYESYVIDQLKSNALLPSLDAEFLNTLRTLRNKSAHPSGHHASAEEARFIFYEAINRFLSKPILTTTQLVDEVLSRMGEKHFFPSTDISKTSSVVRKELKNIHVQAFPYLINKALEKTQSSSREVSVNAGFFLAGFAYQKDPEATEYIKRYIIDAKCSDDKFSLIVLRVISANGAVVNDLDPVTYDRLRSVISRRIENIETYVEHTKFSHPASVMKSIMETSGEDVLIDNFSEQLIEFFGKNIFGKYFIGFMEGNHKVVNLYFEVACRKAGSSDFDAANYFSRNLKSVENALSRSLTPEQSYTLLVNILHAAEGGAWGAEGLRDSKFSSVANLKEKALIYLESDNEGAKSVFVSRFGSDEGFDHSVENYFLA